MTTFDALKSAALPYPVGINVSVFQDDGKWNNYSAWFKRTNADLRSLSVARITLGHWEGTDDPAYTAEEWVRKSAQLVAQYPNCIFVY